jgi:multiple sugar transport system substrate-binding protein
MIPKDALDRKSMEKLPTERRGDQGPWLRSRRRETNMKRWLIAMATFVLVAAACTAGGGTDTPSAVDTGSGTSHEPVTIEMWTEWTSKAEMDDFNKIFPAFEEAYPWITVNTVKNVDSTKLLAAINSGTSPDAVLSFDLDNIGKFCSSGALQDLTPYMESTDFDVSQFPPAMTKYTSYAGSTCALPFLTDAYGLYYNVDMFDKAGITEPPKTTSDLLDVAEKLTVFNPDGSIKVAGFIPYITYYETDPVHLSTTFNVKWYSEDGTASAVATDPAWKELAEWQKELVDFYGYDNLQEFVAGQGDEWGEEQDFQTGRVAMTLDGEWRTSDNFLGDPPAVNYMTAPFPVPDDQIDNYGMGQIGGTIIGLPEGSPHPEEAWLLLSWMATDTDTLVYMANTVRNVPSTYDALASPDLEVTPQFQTFLDILEHPGSHYKESSPIGQADQDLVAAFFAEWQAGDVSDLQSALDDVAQQIDDQLAQAQAP